jgi:hypothetical protein
MAIESEVDLFRRRIRTWLYWKTHPKINLFVTGIVPCVAWCILAYIILGHFADVRNLHGEMRLRFYHFFDPVFFPGLGWLVWRWMRIVWW